MDDEHSECGQEIKRRIIDLVHEMAHDGVIWTKQEYLGHNWKLSTIVYKNDHFFTHFFLPNAIVYNQKIKLID